MPDPKPEPRIRDRGLTRMMHLRGGECALADRTCETRLSIHHINRHPRDDVPGNCLLLCGHGTAGHHGLVEAHDEETLRRLAHVLRRRELTLQYLRWRFPQEDPLDWINRVYG